MSDDPSGYARAIQAIRDDERRKVLDDLRAEAKGLPVIGRHINHADDCPGRPGYRGFCNCDRQVDELVSLDAVLRVLGEGEGERTAVVSNKPTGLGAVVEATFANRRCKCLYAGDDFYIVLHEDAREPGGFWTSRATWSHLTDPVVLSEGLTDAKP